MFRISGEIVSTIDNHDVEQVFKAIKAFISKEQVILVDANGEPLQDEEVISIVKSNDSFDFNSIAINDIAESFKQEVLTYIEQVNEYMSNLENVTDQEIVHSFIDLINALVEIRKASEYFGIEFYSLEQINYLAGESLTRLEKGDKEYIRDVMEYEISPHLEEFKVKLFERYVH